ncbi:MFS transporter [Prosthecochloris sp. SCSIO W1103]|uniref:MFS transporter n=1 Tax=Prosthecochloris sp. SCSIO W1103 TaxID=2992244 RepID=UPI00223DA77E|nr:MFS transporter [Prosthecochloris sp. SCSIO W1103]UZJ38889.1 MFS transporter [Prosthecochloris sp. SCSIO W1103]
MMVTFAFPLYFKNVICEGEPRGDALWGASLGISMLIVAVISPVLGAAADFSGRRKRFLFVFTLFSVVATALLGLTGPGMVVIAVVLFVVANAGFEGGLVFYDAYLPEIASERSIGRVSGYGFAMGYLGALAILLLLFPLLKEGIVIENMQNVTLSFFLVALFFAVFAAPLFFVLRDEKKTAVNMHFVGRSIREVKYTILHIMNYPDLARFLLAFFFYNDAILTIIGFSSIYAQNTLGFTSGELIIFFMVVQTTAIFGSVIFGVITDKIGPKRTIVLTLIIWCVVIMMAIATTDKLFFYYTGLLAGMSMGSSKAASRSMMARLTPPKHVTEFFGFYDGTFGKASAIAGPVIFGVISSLAGDQRIALASLLLFFVIGLFLILGVRSRAAYANDAAMVDGGDYL